MYVAIQGERGSFSEEAARRLSPRLRPLCCSSFDQVFEHLRSGQARAAVIPIENTLAGSVTANYDLLRQEPVTIVAEAGLRIRHQLIAHPAAQWKGIRRVLSHPVALDQCRAFLRRHPNWEVVPHYDTAGSVKDVMQNRLTDTAAIAGEPAARIYHARILRRGIEDHRQNFTRFFLLRSASPAGAPAPRPPAGANKVSVVFSTKNQPGSLFKCLSVFALRDISLTRIESRPAPGKPWEYSFYLDFLGNTNQGPVRHALQNLGEVADQLKILGCYRSLGLA